MKKIIFLPLFLLLFLFPSKIFAYKECYVDNVKVGEIHTYSFLYYSVSGDRYLVPANFNFLIENVSTKIEFWIKEEYLQDQPLFKLGNSNWIPATFSKRESWNGGIRFFAEFTAPPSCGECWANVMYRYVGDGKLHYCEEKRPEYKKSENYPNYLNPTCLNSSGCNLVYPNSLYGWFYEYPYGPEIRGTLSGGGSCDNYLFCLNNYCAPFYLKEGVCYYSPTTVFPTTNSVFRAVKTINSQRPPSPGSNLTITSVDFGGFTVFYKFSDTICGGSQGGGKEATPTPTPAYICPLSLQQLNHNTGTALINSYNENQYANFIANKTGYIDRVEILGELDRDVAKGNKILTCKITDQTGTLNLGESLPNDGPFFSGQHWLTVYFSSFPSVIDGNSYRLYCKVNNVAGGGYIYWRDLLNDKTNKTRKIYICKQNICPSCPLWVNHEDVLRDGSENYNKLIRWSDVDYEDGYEIYLCQTDSSGECFPQYLVTVGKNVTSYIATNDNQGFPPGSKVIYEVRPIKAGCDVLKCSDWVNNVPTAPPVSPSVTPACICGGWQNLSCGDCNCTINEICQVQYCYYNGDPSQGQCDFNTQCVEDSSCQKAWFQTQEGEVHTQSEIISFMPSGNFFSLEGLGGYPGIVSYGEEEVNFGSGNVSSLGWLANTTFVNWFDFDYFKKITEVSSFEELEEIFQENLSSDKEIFGFRGNLKLGEPLNIGTRKIVILVEGKLLINQPITVDINNGGSLFIAASEGIGVSKDITSLSGFFITNEGFYSSVENEFSANDFNEGTPSSQQLILNGGVIAKYFRLTRDLGSQINKTTPAEKFVYQPKIFLNLNPSLWKRTSLWEELAP